MLYSPRSNRYKDGMLSHTNTCWTPPARCTPTISSQQRRLSYFRAAVQYIYFFLPSHTQRLLCYTVQLADLLNSPTWVFVSRIFTFNAMASTTPPVEAPAAPSATVAAVPLTPGSTQLVPEQGSPTVDKPDVSASGQVQDSLPLQTPSVPNVEAAVEAEEVVEGRDYEVYMALRCSCRCTNYELTQRFIAD